jgi:hypothetical protein
LEAGYCTIEELAVKRIFGFRKRVVHPQAGSACGDQARFSEMAEMSGNARLRRLEDVHDVAHAKFAATQETQDAKPRAIAKRAKHHINLSRLIRGLR